MVCVVVVGGPLSACWPAETAGVLETTGLPFVAPAVATGERPTWAPFDHLLRTHRAVRCDDTPVLLVQSSFHDPTLRQLLRDLAAALELHEHIQRVVGLRLQVDPHECFDKVINDPRWRNACFADVQNVAHAKLTLYGREPDVVHDYACPAGLADTPQRALGLAASISDALKKMC